MKSKVWKVLTRELRYYTVEFEEEVTEEEAKHDFLNDAYEDIIDESQEEIEKVWIDKL